MKTFEEFRNEIAKQLYGYDSYKEVWTSDRYISVTSMIENINRVAAKEFAEQQARKFADFMLLKGNRISSGAKDWEEFKAQRERQ